ncbi:hypothetical protein L6452_38616 [Arctium lappa]|uniref:Uncharacterized protein n=1 Tax=Arctium lappa TaxID=4217 RepID=A0ACB8XRS0_ARCLA|nr:hypothetical protein L6452_38616 [Arctium lappa]
MEQFVKFDDMSDAASSHSGRRRATTGGFTQILELHEKMFFDDNIHNIHTAKVTGLDTMLSIKKGVDYALESIHNIREALPEVWESVMKSKDVCDSQKIAIETYVKA